MSSKENSSVEYNVSCPLMSKEELNKLTDKNTKDIFKNLCEYLSQERKRKKLSLRHMYECTNVSIALISDFENGNKIPRLETIIRLATYLGINMYKLFGTKLCPERPLKDKLPPRNDEKYVIWDTLKYLNFTDSECKEFLNYVQYIKSKRKN